MMHFQTILKRSDDEITKKVYVQQTNPVKGDWIDLVKKDFSDIGMKINEEIIKNETKVQWNARIRQHLKANMLV